MCLPWRPPPLCGAGSSDWVLSSPTLKNKKEGILSIVGTLQHSWHLIVFLMWSNSTDANTGQRKNITLGITVQIHRMHSYLQTLSHGRKDSVNNSQHNGMKWEEPSGSGSGKGAQSLITGRKLTSLNCAQMLCGKQVLKAIREREPEEWHAWTSSRQLHGSSSWLWGLTVVCPNKT